MPTQSPGAARAAAGVSEDDVTVNVTYLGGGFGRRTETDFVTDAVSLSQHTGHPVKVQWTREEDMRQDRYRPASLHIMRAGLGNDELLAWSHRIVAPSIFGQKWPGSIEDGLDRVAVMGGDDLAYGISNVLVDYVMANTDVPVGIWRSVAHLQTAFANECFLDEIAVAMGRDPVLLRLQLLEGKPRHRAVLERAADAAGWPGHAKTETDGTHWGVAVHGAFGSLAAMAAEVSVSSDSSINVHQVVCAVDCGVAVNPDTVRSQIEGAVVFGLSAAMYGKINIQDGAVLQSNFHDYPVVRMNEMPSVEVHLVASDTPPSGVGELGVPTVAPAAANAVFAATKKRLRRLPLQL